MDNNITWQYQIADHYCKITWVYNKMVTMSNHMVLMVTKSEYVISMVTVSCYHVIYHEYVVLIVTKMILLLLGFHGCQVINHSQRSGFSQKGEVPHEYGKGSSGLFTTLSTCMCVC